MPTNSDDDFMQAAFQQALKSYNEGGLPIGAVMVQGGQIIASGHNRRVQDGDPTAHGEMDCLRRAGRRPNYRGVTLYTTLSPCSVGLLFSSLSVDWRTHPNKISRPQYTRFCSMIFKSLMQKFRRKTNYGMKTLQGENV
jgi:hypothetical protein